MEAQSCSNVDMVMEALGMSWGGHGDGGPSQVVMWTQ